MKNQSDKPKQPRRGKLGKRAAILYGVLALALVGSGLAARYATSLKLHTDSPAPNTDASESVPDRKSIV